MSTFFEGALAWLEGHAQLERDEEFNTVVRGNRRYRVFIDSEILESSAASLRLTAEQLFSDTPQDTAAYQLLSTFLEEGLATAKPGQVGLRFVGDGFRPVLDDECKE